MSKVTRFDYCQFLVVSQTNYTLTYFAEHSPGFSHDAVKRYLQEDKLMARMVWEQVREAKQTPGIEGCQCCLARIQRNHINNWAMVCAPQLYDFCPYKRQNALICPFLFKNYALFFQ
jgi:hypothetical protein